MRTRNLNTKRMCFVSEKVYEIKDLLRFNFYKKNQLLEIDFDKNKDGRGAWFYPSRENWELLKKTRGLNRTFRFAFNRNIYEIIEKELEEKIWLN